MPSEQDLIDRILSEARKSRFSVKLMHKFAGDLSGNETYEFIGALPALALHDQPIPTTGLAMKRVIDLMLGAMLLILAVPLMLLIALAVKLDSPGPIVYRARRVGKKGREFVCYKFRTMVENAEELKNELLSLNERDGLFFKIAEDPRLTRTGPLLRKYSLDELPQLWSIIKGDMSLVGPRPPSLDEYDQYAPEHLRRLRVTPGLSGLWQVTARRDPSFETYLALDLEYLEKWSLWLDIKILFRTIPAVLGGGGI
jgi:exopolysaccharide biosynthesis polyprenyl glycosylphosphotransferase